MKVMYRNTTRGFINVISNACVYLLCHVKMAALDWGQRRTSCIVPYLDSRPHRLFTMQHLPNFQLIHAFYIATSKTGRCHCSVHFPVRVVHYYFLLIFFHNLLLFVIFCVAVVVFFLMSAMSFSWTLPYIFFIYDYFIFFGGGCKINS